MKPQPCRRPAVPGRSWPLRDGLVSVLVLTGLLIWDRAGADAVVTRWFGTAQGFAWRDHFITAGLLHNGGRLLAWGLLLALLMGTLRAPAPGANGAWAAGSRATATPPRASRRYWFAVTLLCLLLVPAIKRHSATSCPWDLAEFGGSAVAVSHWLWGRADGGPGHCFPSGHAVAAFAFLSQYFLWRRLRPCRAALWLRWVLLIGSLFALAQLARGAHHLSHSAWSAALCWLLCSAASAVQPQRWR